MIPDDELQPYVELYQHEINQKESYEININEKEIQCNEKSAMKSNEEEEIKKDYP